MISDLTTIILSRRRATIIFLAVLFVLGLISMASTPITFYPETTKPKIAISVYGQGYTATDLYNLYSDQLDIIMKQVDEAEKVTAEYNNNRISYVLEFPWNFDTQLAKDKVYNISSRVEAVFPTDAVNSFDKPVISEYSSGSSAFLSAALYSSELNNKELYQEAKNILEGRFNQDVRDLDTIAITPVEVLAADIIFDQAAMMGFGLNPRDIINKVKNRYTDLPMGSFRSNNTNYALRYLADSSTLFKIGNIVIATINNKDITLNEIAEVNVRYDLPSSIFRANGETAVFIMATPSQNGNIRTMANDIKQVLAESEPFFSKKVSSEIFVDPAIFIDDAIGNVINSALQGALLAVIVTLVLLGIPKNSLIIIASIPISIVYSFILIKAFNVSLNLISLSGLALSVGMTVDGAIVVMENIHRHRIENLQTGRQQTLFSTIVKGVAEVRLSVLAGVLTSVCVFFPLAFTAPLASAILGDLALTVVFSLIASLLVGFTVTPLLAYYLFKGEHSLNTSRKDNPLSFKNRMINFSNSLMECLKRSYEAALIKLLNNKKMIYFFIAASVILFLITTLVIIRLIPMEIMATPTSNKIYLVARNSQVDEVEDFIIAFEDIEAQVMVIIGDELQSRFLETRGSSVGSLLISLKSSKKTTQFIDALNDQLTGDEWTFFVQQWDPAEMPLPTVSSLKIQVTGPNRLQILGYMERIQDEINRSRLYSFVRTNPPTMPSQEMALEINHEVLSELAISDNDLINLSKIYLSGSTLTLDEEGEEVKAKFSYPTIDNSESVLNLQIPYANKASLPLSYFFNAIFQEGVSRLVIENQQESYFIEAFVRSSEKEGAGSLLAKQQQIEKIVKEKITIAPGYNILFTDSQKEINETLSSLMGALVISIILIFLILAVQFNSYKLPLVIVTAIPLGIIGAIIALKVANSTLSINSLLGIILLGGTAVNNSIMIADFYLNNNTISNKIEAIINASTLRLAPILTSVLTTLLGMLPIALALGDGSNVIQPLGIAVSGGLAISTFFTLFMIPTILSLMSRPSRDDHII